MKSKKITSIKQAREIIDNSNVLSINEDDATDANLISCWCGNYYLGLGYLYRGRKSRKVYMMLDTLPSIQHA